MIHFFLSSNDMMLFVIQRKFSGSWKWSLYSSGGSKKCDQKQFQIESLKLWLPHSGSLVPKRKKGIYNWQSGLVPRYRLENIIVDFGVNLYLKKHPLPITHSEFWRDNYSKGENKEDLHRMLSIFIFPIVSFR